MSKLKDLERLLAQGKITRRDFLAQASALGVIAGAPAIFSNQALAATPNKGGKFTAGIGHGSTTDSLDPGTYENDFMINSSFTRFNFLTEISNTGELAGELAESWEASADAKTWTIKLRQGVEFHNGKAMTADDVVASINHHRGEDSGSAAKPIVDPIEEIKADGNNVVVTLSGGNADFPYLMSDYHLPIMQAKDGGVDWESGIGTGPYAMQSYDPGVRMIFKRNANYFKPDRAHFDEVEMITIADVAARTNALATGEIHMMDRVDIKTMHLLERNKSVKIEETSGNGHYSIPMRTTLEPFTDNNIRLALKYALDREALLETILRGHGYIGNDHPIGKANRYFAADLPQKSYDPDKSKFYLKEAGLSELSVDLSAADAAFGGAVDAAVLFKEHAAKAGITINVVREPNDGYWSNVWNTDNRGWCMCYWGGRPTEDWMFSTAYASGAEWNDSSWEHEEFNKLLVAARAELDEAKRRDRYVEMQRLVSDEGGVMVPVFNNYIFATSDKVAHDEQMANNWSDDGHKWAERWWFA
ncbi:MAG: ABC transporter substrate-binding protein [Gammaproteobacteria bacterium]|nr:ABC transporter substrate-binding protein [Gammaproteobacteria bacterium]